MTNNVSNMVTRKILARNIFSNGIGLSVEVVTAFILTPVIVSTLGVGFYGVWSLLVGIIGYMGIADMGVRGSAGRYINMYLARGEYEEANQVFSTSLVLLMLLSVIIIPGAAILAANIGALFPKIPESMRTDILVILPTLALLLAVNFQTSVFQQVLLASDRFDLSNLIQIVATLTRFTLALFLLSKGFGISGLLIANLSSALVSYLAFLCMVSLVNPKMRFKRSAVNFQKVKDLSKFGSSVLFVRSNSQLITQIDQVIVMAFFGAEATGFYSLARVFTGYTSLVKEKVGSVLIPSTQKLGGLQDIPALRAILYSYVTLTGWAGVLINVGLIVFGGAFVNLWLGEGYEQVVQILSILALASLVSYASSNAQAILFSLGKLRINMVVSTAMSVTNIMCSVLLVMYTDLGMVAVAVGTLLTSLIINAVTYPCIINLVLQSDFIMYFYRGVLPLIFTSTASYFSFIWLAANFDSDTWLKFGISISVALVVYLMISGPVIYYSRNRKTMI